MCKEEHTKLGMSTTLPRYTEFQTYRYHIMQNGAPKVGLEFNFPNDHHLVLGEESNMLR